MKNPLGNTTLLTHAQVVLRAKEIVQAALDERDKAIAEAQGMLCVVSAVMMKNGGEIVVTQDDLDNAPRNLAFETDANGSRRICRFEMREAESSPTETIIHGPGCVPGSGCVGDPTSGCVRVPEGEVNGKIVTEAPVVGRLTPSGSKIELM